MRRLAVLAASASVALVAAAPAEASSGRPVALVSAETADEVLAVALGPHGGKVLRRVHLADPLMIAASLHGPAVVVNPHGIVTLLGWHSLRPVKAFHSFRDPQVAAIAPGGRFAYVADGASGKLTVIDLVRRRIVDRVFVGAEAHHMGFSPNGHRLWVALGEDATTVVRLDTSTLRRPRVLGRIHPPNGAHDLKFASDDMAWVSSPTAAQVAIYSAGGTLLEGARAGRGPQHLAFSGGDALISSGYGSSLESIAWHAPYHALRKAAVPYGSFNLATYGGFVVTASLFTGQVSEFRVRDLHRLWTAKVAPAARYVAISLWPRRRTASRTLSLGPGRVVRRFTLRQPHGGLRSWRLTLPSGTRASLQLQGGPAPYSILSIGTFPPALRRASNCHRAGSSVVCGAWFEPGMGLIGAGYRWRARLVKSGGPPAHVRVDLGVYPRRY